MVHLWPQQQTLVEIQQCVWVWQYSLCLIKASSQLNTLLEPNDTTIIQHKPSLPHDHLPCGVTHRYCIERNLSSRLFWMLITQVWIVYRVQTRRNRTFHFNSTHFQIYLAVRQNQPFGEMEMFYYFATFTTRLLSYYRTVFIEFAEVLVWHLNAICRERLKTALHHTISRRHLRH